MIIQVYRGNAYLLAASLLARKCKEYEARKEQIETWEARQQTGK